MAGKNEFRTLPPTLESFGIAIDFLSRFAPFNTAEVGTFGGVVRRQVLRGEHVIAWDGENLNGYAGWLPTTRRAAEIWLADGGELPAADEDADAVALTVVAVEDARIVLGLIRAARALNPRLRVFFKRSYADKERKPRKSVVLNRDFVSPPLSAPARAGEAVAATRPPIADDPCGFLFELAARSPGKTERVAVGRETIIVVQDPAVAAHVLVANGANYAKNFASFAPLLGESRLTLDGERWRQSQRLTQPHIAPHDLPRAEAILVDRHARLAEAFLTEAGDGGEIDGLVDRAVVAALVAVAFSADADDLGTEFVGDLRRVIRYSARHAWDLPGVPVAPDEAVRADSDRAATRIRKTVAGLVAHRRVQRPRAPDALTALIEASDRLAAGPAEQRIDLEGEIVTLIVAGSDTTAAAMGWALAILAEHPDFQDQLRQEIVAAVGDHPPKLADVDKVPSLRLFLDETLRMFPPVAILSRMAIAEDEIGGHKVQAGDRVLVSVIGIHQNPAVWESPREFRLERHGAESGARAGRKSAFLPFSSGPRVCGGARFAQMEMSLALMLILRRCRLDLPVPLPLAFEWGASMRRAGGQRIRVRPLQ